MLFKQFPFKIRQKCSLCIYELHKQVDETNARLKYQTIMFVDTSNSLCSKTPMDNVEELHTALLKGVTKLRIFWEFWEYSNGKEMYEMINTKMHCGWWSTNGEPS